MKEKIKVFYSEKAIDYDDVILRCADLVVLGSQSFETLDFKNEVNGQGGVFDKMKTFSKKVRRPVFIAIKTNDYGKIRRSVVALEDGKLLTIADCNGASLDNFGGFGYKICHTSLGKLGIIVANDIKNTEALKALLLCESRLIINLYVDVYDFNVQNLVASLGYLFGTPIISCGGHGVVATNGVGKIDFSSNKDRAEFCLSTKRSLKTVNVKTPFNI